MAERNAVTRMEGLLTRWAELLSSKTRPLLILFLVLTALSVSPALNFQLESSENVLFPSALYSSQENENLSQGIGATDILYGVVEGGTLAEKAAFISELVNDLTIERDRLLDIGQDGMLQYAIYRLPISFFEDRRLLYLKIADLLDIESRLKRRLEQERMKHNPFYIDLEQQEESEVDISFQDLQAKYGMERFQEYTVSVDQNILVALFKPTQPSSDIGFSQRLVEWVRNTAQARLQKQHKSGLKFSIGGSYIEQIVWRDTIDHDRKVCHGIFFICFALLTLLIFRRPRPLILLGLVGISFSCWMVALVTLYYHSVNLFGFTAIPIALTLCLTYGLLFLYKYAELRRLDYDVHNAVKNIVIREGEIMLPVALIVAIVLLGMSFFSFPGMALFCRIAAIGILLILVAVLGFLPVLLLTSEHVSLMIFSSSVRIVQPMPRRMPRGKAVVAIGVGLVLVTAVLFFQSWFCWQKPWCSSANRCCDGEDCCKPAIDFEYDFLHFLPAPPRIAEVEKKFKQAVPIHLRPVVIVAPSRNELHAFLKKLDTEQEGDPDPAIQNESSILRFVPAEQEKKKEILARIDQLATHENIAFLDRRIQRKIDDVRSLLHPSSVSIYQLPISVIRVFSQQPTGTEKILEILHRSLRTLPDTITDSEWDQAVLQTLQSLSDGQLIQLYRDIRQSELAGELDKKDSQKLAKPENLLPVFRAYHSRYVGTVAYLYPAQSAFQGKAALATAEFLQPLLAKHPNIEAYGQMMELASMLNKLKPMLYSGLLAGLLAVMVILPLIFRPFPRLFLIPTPVIVGNSILILSMSIFSIKWNIYILMGVPILLWFGFDASIRMYLRYWRDGLIGAVQSLIAEGQAVLVAVLTLLFSQIGWLSFTHRGAAIVGLATLLGVIAFSLACFGFFPALLELYNARLQRRRLSFVQKKTAPTRKWWSG